MLLTAIKLNYIMVHKDRRAEIWIYDLSQSKWELYPYRNPVRRSCSFHSYWILEVLASESFWFCSQQSLISSMEPSSRFPSSATCYTVWLFREAVSGREKQSIQLSISWNTAGDYGKAMLLCSRIMLLASQLTESQSLGFYQTSILTYTIQWKFSAYEKQVKASRLLM